MEARVAAVLMSSVTTCPLLIVTVCPATGTTPPAHGALRVVELQFPEPPVVIWPIAAKDRKMNINPSQSFRLFVFLVDCVKILVSTIWIELRPTFLPKQSI